MDISKSYNYINVTYTSPKQNYHRSGVYSVTYTILSLIYMFKNYTFTFTDQSAKPTVMNPYSCFGPVECGSSWTSSPIPTRIKKKTRAKLYA